MGEPYFIGVVGAALYIGGPYFIGVVGAALCQYWFGDEGDGFGEQGMGATVLSTSVASS